MTKKELHEQDDALDQYLDSLLQESPRDDNDQQGDQVEPYVPVDLNEEPGEHTGTNDVETTQDNIEDLKDQALSIPDAHDAQDMVHNPVAEDEPESASTPSNIPEWAAQPFKGMLFNVLGITIAAPSSSLKGFLEYSDRIIPMDQAEDYVIGQLEHLNHQLTVIDTAKLLFDNGYQQNDHNQPNNLVVISGTNLALACDSIADTIDIDPGQVRWKKGHTKHPWYVGIITAQKCAILDIDQLIQTLSP